MDKSLVIAVVAFLIVASLVCMLLLTDVLLMFFYAVFGNQVYALTIKYTVDSSPDFTFSLAQMRIPIESVLSSYKIVETGETHAGNITLNIIVFVLNRQYLWTGTFNFADANQRQITIYLPKLKPFHESVSIELTGYYNMAPITAGTKIQIE